MAKITKENFKELSTPDLIARIKEDRLKYKKTRFNHTVSHLDNPMLLKGMRRDVAKLLTELRKRQLAEQSK